MTKRLTPYNVWKWLRDNGPHRIEDIAKEFNKERDEVAKVTRFLMGGHRSDKPGIRYIFPDVQWRYTAYPLDELPLAVGPFGAGAGDTTSSEAPINKEI